MKKCYYIGVGARKLLTLLQKFRMGERIGKHWFKLMKQVIKLFQNRSDDTL